MHEHIKQDIAIVNWYITIASNTTPITPGASK